MNVPASQGTLQGPVKARCDYVGCHESPRRVIVWQTSSERLMLCGMHHDEVRKQLDAELRPDEDGRVRLDEVPC